MLLPALRTGLETTVRQLVIISPSDDSMEVVGTAQLAVLQAQKAELVAAAAALVIDSQESFTLAGELVAMCDILTDAIEERFADETAKANKRHKALTGTCNAAKKEIVEIGASTRKKRAEWKAFDDARIAAEAMAAQARLRAEAEAKRQEDLRLAREEAERVQREADEAAQKARGEGAAAIEAGDPDAAMEAAAALEEIQESTGAKLFDAALAVAEAEIASETPVVIPRVEVAVAAREDGVTWVDNWVAEYDEVEALMALVVAGAVEYLMVNAKAINAAAKSQKSLARIPGVNVVNRKQERRRGT